MKITVNTPPVPATTIDLCGLTVPEAALISVLLHNVKHLGTEDLVNLNGLCDEFDDTPAGHGSPEYERVRQRLETDIIVFRS